MKENQPKRELQAKHDRAIEMLATGASVTETATELGVSRQTVSEWLNHDETFRREYNERRLQNREALSNRLMSLVPKATQVLEAKLEGPQGLQAALHIIRAAGAFADSDLKEARFQQLARDEVVQVMLDALKQLGRNSVLDEGMQRLVEKYLDVEKEADEPKTAD